MHGSSRRGSTTGWAIGYDIAIVVVLVVVALVVPILLLAHSIGDEAQRSTTSLSSRSTTPPRWRS